MFIVHVHCSLFMFIVHCSHGATLIFDDVFSIKLILCLVLVQPNQIQPNPINPTRTNRIRSNPIQSTPIIKQYHTYNTVQVVEPPKRVLVEREVCNRIDGCPVVKGVCESCEIVKR